MVAAQQSVFHNPLTQKPLMDCIALASFTHTHTREASGTVRRYWAENCHCDKVTDAHIAVATQLIQL
jgi:hypothetical protein